MQVDELLQQLVIEGELVHVVDAVWEESEQVRALARFPLLQELLQRVLNSLCEVHRVAEVEAVIILEGLYHVDELLVLLWPDNRNGWVRQWDVQELVDEHDLGATLQHLSDYRGFLNQDQVLASGELHLAKDAVDFLLQLGSRIQLLFLLHRVLDHHEALALHVSTSFNGKVSDRTKVHLHLHDAALTAKRDLPTPVEVQCERRLCNAAYVDHAFSIKYLFFYLL